jgi:hypothetical protein
MPNVHCMIVSCVAYDRSEGDQQRGSGAGVPRECGAVAAREGVRPVLVPPGVVPPPRVHGGRVHGRLLPLRGLRRRVREPRAPAGGCIVLRLSRRPGGILHSGAQHSLQVRFPSCSKWLYNNHNNKHACAGQNE